MIPEPGIRSVIVLGATGSIGRQTLECIEWANSSGGRRFEVAALTAHSDEAALMAAGSSHPSAALVLTGRAASQKAIAYSGADALARLFEHTKADVVVNGIAGAEGLKASVAALETGCILALANKESVVMGHSLLVSTARRSRSSIIPVDSEHAALFQLFSRIGADSIDELTITASGGPFRARSIEELGRITPEEAAAHPVWKMGRKISIDSATLANKGLELIEAVRLFRLPEEKVKVLVHPESLVHALVRTRDGTLYANISSPDMRLPIFSALSWPEQTASPFGRLELEGRSLRFEAPDDARFPLLGLARSAVRTGEAATIAYNAADEEAVAAFERRAISFTGIAEAVKATLDSRDWSSSAPDFFSIFEFDREARKACRKFIEETQC